MDNQDLISQLDKVMSQQKTRRSSVVVDQNLPKSREGLLRELKQLASELESLGYRRTSISYQGIRYGMSKYFPGKVTRDSTVTMDDKDVPTVVLERLITVIRRRLTKFHTAVDDLVKSIPDQALPYQLEGMSGLNLIRSIYLGQLGKLSKIVESISLPESVDRIHLKIKVKVGDNSYNIGVDKYPSSSRLNSHASVDELTIHPTSEATVMNLISFIKNFGIIKSQVQDVIAKMKAGWR